VECKLRCVNFRRVSDPKRAFQPTFGVLGISDDQYRSTLEVIVLSLGISGSAGKNFECIWEYLGAPATGPGAPMASMVVPATSLGAPTTCLGVPATSLGAPRLTVEQTQKNIFFGNIPGAPGNHSYYLLFNDF
jgi:hypothetical protein